VFACCRWQRSNRGGGGGAAQVDEKDCERLEIVARLMMGIAEIDDLNMMRDKSVKLLQQKIMELSEEQKHLSANAAPQKVGAWLGVGLKGVGGVGGGWAVGGCRVGAERQGSGATARRN
jgi:hypothetical protein